MQALWRSRVTLVLLSNAFRLYEFRSTELEYLHTAKLSYLDIGVESSDPASYFVLKSTLRTRTIATSLRKIAMWNNYHVMLAPF